LNQLFPKEIIARFLLEKGEHAMGTIREIVCGLLVVITFAAILYSVPL
jgi:hypothetical protein